MSIDTSKPISRILYEGTEIPLAQSSTGSGGGLKRVWSGAIGKYEHALGLYNEDYGDVMVYEFYHDDSGYWVSIVGKSDEPDIRGSFPGGDDIIIESVCGGNQADNSITWYWAGGGEGQNVYLRNIYKLS